MTTLTVAHRHDSFYCIMHTRTPAPARENDVEHNGDCRCSPQQCAAVAIAKYAPAIGDDVGTCGKAAPEPSKMVQQRPEAATTDRGALPNQPPRPPRGGGGVKSLQRGHGDRREYLRKRGRRFTGGRGCSVPIVLRRKASEERLRGPGDRSSHVAAEERNQIRLRRSSARYEGSSLDDGRTIGPACGYLRAEARTRRRPSAAPRSDRLEVRHPRSAFCGMNDRPHR